MGSGYPGELQGSTQRPEQGGLARTVVRFLSCCSEGREMTSEKPTQEKAKHFSVSQAPNTGVILSSSLLEDPVYSMARKHAESNTHHCYHLLQATDVSSGGF